MIICVIGRAAPLTVGNNAIIILLLKDLCCIGSLASQVALRDRLTGAGADKHGAANYRENMHGITRTFTRIRVPSHVIILRNGRHRQRQRHLHARLLVSDPEYLLHRLLALRLDKLPCFIVRRGALTSKE